MKKYNYPKCPRGMPDWQHENGTHVDIMGVGYPFKYGRIYCAVAYVLKMRDGPPVDSYIPFRPLPKDVPCS